MMRHLMQSNELPDLQTVKIQIIVQRCLDGNSNGIRGVATILTTGNLWIAESLECHPPRC